MGVKWHSNHERHTIKFNHQLFYLGLGLAVVVIGCSEMEVVQAKYSDQFVRTFGAQNVRSINNDHAWQLILDNVTSSAIESKSSYTYGSFDMNIRLAPGDSAGTVTSFYMASQSETQRDELDFEFLGNVSGQPYILQTNVYWNGTYGREQRIYLWFDPTTTYHTYSIIWNPYQILFLVDGVPIRVVKNNENLGIPFLQTAMKAYASIWDGSTWATEGGRIKIDWQSAPFVASFGKFKFDVCRKSIGTCIQKKWWNAPQYQVLSSHQKNQLKWVTKKQMVYDYCKDRKRYPNVPFECLT